MKENFKVRIFQPIVPEYRVALYEGLGRKYGNRLSIFASEKWGSVESCQVDGVETSYKHKLIRIWALCWQVGFSLKGLSRGDVVVVCGDVHQLSSIRIALLAMFRGISVVWWGHHRTATSTELSTRIRLNIAKVLSKVALVYTKAGVEYLERNGFEKGRVFSTGNTIDQTPIKAAIKVVKEGFRANPLLLCCGVLRKKMHLELLIRAIADGRLKDMELVVIGDGPMKNEWQKLASDLGVGKRVTWVPGTRDQMVMAPWFLSAKAFVYPGSIGLSILHSFSYGLPVVTHGNINHQMPEFEVMEDGRTGLCFIEGDVDDLVRKVLFLLSDESRRRQIGQYCQELAFKKYSMDQMIENYCQAIEAAAAL